MVRLHLLSKSEPITGARERERETREQDTKQNAHTKALIREHANNIKSNERCKTKTKSTDENIYVYINTFVFMCIADTSSVSSRFRICLCVWEARPVSRLAYKLLTCWHIYSSCLAFNITIDAATNSFLPLYLLQLSQLTLNDFLIVSLFALVTTIVTKFVTKFNSS